MRAHTKNPALSRFRFKEAGEQAVAMLYRPIIHNDPPTNEDDTASKSRKNDFFELPCELQDAVYEYPLSPNTNVDYMGGLVLTGPSQPGDVCIANLCKVDLMSSSDLPRVERLRPTCCFVGFPYGCHLPIDLKSANISAQRSTFEHYGLRSSSTTPDTARRMLPRDSSRS